MQDREGEEKNSGSSLVPVNTQEALPAEIVRSYIDAGEEEVHIRDYLEVLMRRKWIVIVFLVIVVATVTLGSFLMKPVYLATSTLRIDRKNPNVLDFKDVQQIDRIGDDYYQTQYKVLQSRTLAKRVIKRLSLFKNPDIIGKDIRTDSLPASFEETGKGFRSSVIDKFLDHLKISPVRKSQLVEVGFMSHSPALAATVANTIADEYIEFNLDSRLDASVQARKWLEKQIENLRAKLEVSEERLNSYIEKSDIILFNQEKDYRTLLIQKLAELSTELGAATADRISKESLYNQIKESGANNSVVLNSSLIQSLKVRYEKLESEYSKMLNQYKPGYSRMLSLKKQMDNLKANIDSETKRIISSIESDYGTALKRESYLSANLKKARKEVMNVQKKMIQYQILKREVDSNRQLYNNLLQRLKEVGVSATLSASNIQVLDRAESPLRPYRPRKTLNIVLSLIVGLFGGVFLAFFIEYFDNSVKSVDEVEKKYLLPVLGVIPLTEQDDGTHLMIDPADRGSLAEAFRSLGTYIQLSSASRPPRTIMVTSSMESEGKSTVAVNTALSSMTYMGNGILVDADLRKPSVHKFFDVDNSAGLSSFLSGLKGLDEIVQKSKYLGLDVITSGPIPPNPSELLSSAEMKGFLDDLSTRYDFVIIDSPPVLGLSDSPVMSTMSDGVIVVVSAGRTSGEALVQTKKILLGVHSKILGVVLNRVKYRAQYGYYSYYYHNYRYAASRKKTGIS